MEELARHWTLDPAVVFLNHGSFGACPIPVLEAQSRYRAQLEREPVRFFVRDFEPLLDAARAELGRFVGADPEDLAFVPNATHGVNTILRSLDFEAGDELVTTDHAYNACRNALEAAAARTGARVVVAKVPFPLARVDEAVQAILRVVTPRTRLAMIDHITSPTGLVFPILEIVRALSERGVETLVDGAHAPGMVKLDLKSLGAPYYTGNCHKWLCAPKGAAFLYVRRDRQRRIRPLVVSHGANSPRRDRSRFLLELDWTGTHDPSAYLSVPDAIRFVGSLMPGGWDEVTAANRRKALAARETLCRALGVPPPCPEEMIGSLAALPLPDDPAPKPRSPLTEDPLELALFEQHRIEVPIHNWPAPPKRLVRISAHLYNRPEQYQRLAQALTSRAA